MSVHTGTPAGIPTRTSPEAPLAVTLPRGARVDRQVAAAGRHATRRSRASPTRRSPEPVFTTVGPPLVADLDVAGPGRDRERALGVPDVDVAGAALDPQRGRARRRPSMSPEPVSTQAGAR